LFQNGVGCLGVNGTNWVEVLMVEMVVATIHSGVDNDYDFLQYVCQFVAHHVSSTVNNETFAERRMQDCLHSTQTCRSTFMPSTFGIEAMPQTVQDHNQ
jgi:hypothetical protein